MSKLISFLTHAEDLETEMMGGVALKWLCNDRLLTGTALTVGLCTLAPGAANPRHYHPNCEEVLYVWSGRGRHLLGEEWLSVRTGTTVRIPLGMHHQLVNEGDEPLVCVIAFSTGDRQTVFLED
jgi:quercetin dioxygenase-like cupin family protein